MEPQATLTTDENLAAAATHSNWWIRNAGPIASFVVVTAAYAQAAVRDWNSFAVGAFDTGIMAQVVQSYARFQSPHSAIKGYSNMLADHFSPVLATLAPLWWMWPDPRVLLLAQAALLGIGAAGIYVVSKRNLGLGFAIGAVALFATWQGTQAGGTSDIHEVAFYVPLSVWAIERALAQRWYSAWILAACFLLVREDGGLMLASFGLWAVTRGRRKDAFIGIAAGFLSTLAIAALLRHLDAQVGWPGYFPLQHFGPTPLAALEHMIRHPWSTMTAVVSPHVKFNTIVASLRPYLFLPLISPMALIWVPQLVLRLLSGREVFWSIGFHYGLPIAGILTLSYVDGIHRVQSWNHRARTGIPAGLRVRWLNGLLLTAAAVMCAANLVNGPLLEGASSNVLDPYRAGCKSAIAAVPPAARVAAMNLTASYLVARHEVRLWRGGAAPGEYILVGPPGDNGHLGAKFHQAVARIKAASVTLVSGRGCQLYHYTKSVPLPELITIAKLQPDPTGKTRG